MTSCDSLPTQPWNDATTTPSVHTEILSYWIRKSHVESARRDFVHSAGHIPGLPLVGLVHDTNASEHQTLAWLPRLPRYPTGLPSNTALVVKWTVQNHKHINYLHV